MDSEHDFVNALMDYFVSPMLPLKDTGREIPLHQQHLVAVQIHAVVVLYNYYHRKQYAGIKFLGFEEFSNLAAILKPTLMAHMKPTNISDCADADDSEDNVSVTVKAVMDACDLCVYLDNSKEVPNVEGWPVSRVAVLVTDTGKQNCVLQLNSTTQGVWSLIEKSLDDRPVDIDEKMDMKHASKKQKIVEKMAIDASNVDEAMCLKFALNAVKETTGINPSDLVVLESHIVYSLSKAKTTVRFYIMQTNQSLGEDVEIPIKQILESMQGPLVRKSSSTWAVTPVVEYFHVLPYADILAQWFSRNEMQDQHMDVGIPRGMDVLCDNDPIIVRVEPTKISTETNTVSNLKSGSSTSPRQQKDNEALNISNSSADPQNIVVDNFSQPIESSTETNTVSDLKSGSSTAPRQQKDNEALNISNSTADPQNMVVDNFSQPIESSTETNTVSNLKSGSSTAPRQQKDNEALNVSKSSAGPQNMVVDNFSQPIESLTETNTVSNLKSGSSTAPRQQKDNEALIVSNSSAGPQNMVVDNFSQPIESSTETNTVSNLKRGSSTAPRQQKDNEALNVYNSSAGPQNMVVENFSQPIESSTETNTVSNLKSRSSTALRQQKDNEALNVSNSSAGPQNMVVDNFSAGPNNLVVNNFSAGPQNHSSAEVDCNDKLSKKKNEVVPINTILRACVVESRKEKLGAETSKTLSNQIDVIEVPPVTLDPKQTLAQATLTILFKQRSRLEIATATDYVAEFIEFPPLRISGKTSLLKVGNLILFTKFCDQIECYQRRAIEKEIVACDQKILECLDADVRDKRLQHLEHQASLESDGKLLSEAVLCLSNSCQLLDDMCHENNWTMPSYNVNSLAGGFTAHVNVKGTDFDCSAEGDVHSSLPLAMGSAAKKVLAKLLDLTGQNQ